MKKTSKVYLVLALLFIGLGLGLFFYNISLDLRAKKLNQKIVERLEKEGEEREDLEVKEERVERPVREIDGVDFIGSLVLESLDKELAIAAHWDYDIIKKYPARYKGDSYQDPLIILAHNYSSHFGDLDQLKEGDLIHFIDIYKRKTSYRVEILEVIDQYQLDYMEDTDYDLSLFTCSLDRVNRITIRARKIENF